MGPNRSTVFVAGAPAAGKTTIGRATAVELRRTFRTIDDWTPRGISITDMEVELALGKLFSAAQPGDEIIEFCHHAYRDLLAANTYPFFTSAPKIVVLASVASCRARNQVRRSPVRDDYVKRACESAEWLAEHSQEIAPARTLVIRTDEQSESAAIEAAARFIRNVWRLR